MMIVDTPNMAVHISALETCLSKIVASCGSSVFGVFKKFKALKQNSFPEFNWRCQCGWHLNLELYNGRLSSGYTTEDA